MKAIPHEMTTKPFFHNPRLHAMQTMNRAIGSRLTKKTSDREGNIHFRNAPSKINRKKNVQMAILQSLYSWRISMCGAINVQRRH